MVTFAELRRARPETYRMAAQAWITLVAVLDEQGGRVRDGGRALGDGWGGAAANAAGTHLRLLGRELRDGAAQVDPIPGVLEGHAAAVETARSTIDHAVAACGRTPVEVSGAGVVSMSALTYLVPALVPLWQRLAAEVQSVIDTAVAQVTTADRETASRLRALLPATASTPAAPLGRIPPRGTDPREVHRWWRGLTPAQRERLLLAHPERVGVLDGVPALDRDRANRTVFASIEDVLRRRRDELLAEGDARSPAEDAELDELDDKLHGMAAIRDRISGTGPGRQPAYLVGFDVYGRGHAIVAMGNPDTADNVLTFVPGAGSRLGSIGGDLGRADLMVDAARTAEPSETTAAIVWIGYDAPQEIVGTDLARLGDGATSDDYAMAARNDLDRFQDGLRVTHEAVTHETVTHDTVTHDAGGASHNTVLGHSYGSTVVGYAARDRGLDADDVIFVGSPGVGVDHARDLGIPPEHVWSSTARNDPIQYGYDPLDLARAGIGLDPRADLIHGANPSDPAFGGQVFASDPGDPLLRWEWQRHGPFGGVAVPVPHVSGHAHSQYWDPGSASLANIGQIIVGNRPIRSAGDVHD